jgi:hypothetical protein
MLNSEVLDLMMARLGDRRAPLLRARLLIELNQKIRELEKGAVIPWFLETRYEGVTVIDQDSITVPTNFLREVEDGRFRVQNIGGAWKPLKKIPLERLERLAEGWDCEEQIPPENSIPLVYSLNGNRFYFAPTPDAVYPLRVQIYTRSTAIADTAVEVTNSWLLEYFNYTTLSALSIVANLHAQSMEVAQKIDKELKLAADSFWRDVEARQHVNMDYLLDNTEN